MSFFKKLAAKREKPFESATDATVFDYKEAASHGFLPSITAIAFDHEQKLLAIGNKDGGVKVIGKCGVEWLLCEPQESSAVERLYFLTGESKLLVLTDAPAIDIYDLAMRMHEDNIVPKRGLVGFTASSLAPGSNNFFLGDSDGGICSVNIDRRDFSLFRVAYDAVMSTENMEAGDEPAVVAVEAMPADPAVLLIGYSDGVVVLFNVVSRKPTHTFVTRTAGMVAVAVHHTGKQFACGFQSGLVQVWTTANQSAPLLSLYATPGEAERRAVTQLLWSSHSSSSKSGKESSILLAAGGNKTEENPFIAVFCGEKFDQRVFLPVDGTVVSLCLCCPAVTPQHLPSNASAVLALTKKSSIFAFTISHTPGSQWPCTLVSHGLQHPHCTTALSFVPGVSTEFIEELALLSAANPTHGPAEGGLFEDRQVGHLWPSLLFSGHEDGTVKVWDSSLVALKPLDLGDPMRVDGSVTGVVVDGDAQLVLAGSSSGNAVAYCFSNVPLTYVESVLDSAGSPAQQQPPQQPPSPAQQQPPQQPPSPQPPQQPEQSPQPQQQQQQQQQQQPPPQAQQAEEQEHQQQEEQAQQQQATQAQQQPESSPQEPSSATNTPITEDDDLPPVVDAKSDDGGEDSDDSMEAATKPTAAQPEDDSSASVAVPVLECIEEPVEATTSPQPSADAGDNIQHPVPQNVDVGATAATATPIAHLPGFQRCITLTHKAAITALLIASGDDCLVVGDEGGTLTIATISTGKLIHSENLRPSPSSPASAITSLTACVAPAPLAPGGRPSDTLCTLLYISQDNGNISTLDLKTGARISWLIPQQPSPCVGVFMFDSSAFPLASPVYCVQPSDDGSDDGGSDAAAMLDPSKNACAFAQRVHSNSGRLRRSGTVKYAVTVSRDHLRLYPLPLVKDCQLSKVAVKAPVLSASVLRWDNASYLCCVTAKGTFSVVSLFSFSPLYEVSPESLHPSASLSKPFFSRSCIASDGRTLLLTENSGLVRASFFASENLLNTPSRVPALFDPQRVSQSSASGGADSSPAGRKASKGLFGKMKDMMGPSQAEIDSLFEVREHKYDHGALPSIDAEEEAKFKVANSEAMQAKQSLQERGEKIGQLNEKVASMHQTSQDMISKLQEYNAKQAAKKWYQL